MKKIILIVSFLILSGCVNHSAESYQRKVNQKEILVANNENVSSELESSSESQADDSIEISNEVAQQDFPNRDPEIKQAWTDYSQYAQPDDAGYAYYIHNDPDISSEIFPIEDQSSDKVLLFTFDDAPQAPDSYALEIAQLLKEKDVNAIFLVNGMYLESDQGKEITREIFDLGFEIGNHTQYHPDLKEMSYEEQYAEINQTNQLVEEITGAPVRWFRPPFGLYNMDTILICNELGLQLMTWTFGYDWQEEYLDGPALAEVSLTTDYLHNGANILMHDRSWTLEALEEMVDGYHAQGYHIVDPYLIKHQENSTEIHNLSES